MAMAAPPLPGTRWTAVVEEEARRKGRGVPNKLGGAPLHAPTHCSGTRTNFHQKKPRDFDQRALAPGFGSCLHPNMLNVTSG